MRAFNALIGLLRFSASQLIRMQFQERQMSKHLPNFNCFSRTRSSHSNGVSALGFEALMICEKLACRAVMGLYVRELRFRSTQSPTRLLRHFLCNYDYMTLTRTQPYRHRPCRYHQQYHFDRVNVNVVNVRSLIAHNDDKNIPGLSGAGVLSVFGWVGHDDKDRE
jgi:hypothetical protein